MIRKSVDILSHVTNTVLKPFVVVPIVNFNIYINKKRVGIYMNRQTTQN